jgi:hypothetical protein
MRTTYKLISAMFALALLSVPAAAQQSAKSGKYKGTAAFHLPGGVEQTYELEKGHVFILGPAHGVFLNDVAGGFIDKTEVVCPRVLDIVNEFHSRNTDTALRPTRMATRLSWSGRGKAAQMEPEGVPSSGPVAPGSTPAFRETTISAIPALAKRPASQLCGRVTGDCHKRRYALRA